MSVLESMPLKQWGANSLPPPEVLVAYNSIAPNLGAQIVEDFVQESEHRRARELAEVNHKIESRVMFLKVYEKAHQFMYFVAMMSIGLSVFLALKGFSMWGVFASVLPIGLVMFEWIWIAYALKMPTVEEFPL